MPSKWSGSLGGRNIHSSSRRVGSTFVCTRLSRDPGVVRDGDPTNNYTGDLDSGARRRHQTRYSSERHRPQRVGPRSVGSVHRKLSPTDFTCSRPHQPRTPGQLSVCSLQTLWVVVSSSVGGSRVESDFPRSPGTPRRPVSTPVGPFPPDAGRKSRTKRGGSALRNPSPQEECLGVTGVEILSPFQRKGTDGDLSTHLLNPTRTPNTNGTLLRISCLAPGPGRGCHRRWYHGSTETC